MENSFFLWERLGEPFTSKIIHISIFRHQKREICPTEDQTTRDQKMSDSKTVFKTIDALRPDTSGHNLLVKVIYQQTAFHGFDVY